jgi:hypothetical protein
MADLLEGPAPTGAPAFIKSAFRDLAPQPIFQEKTLVGFCCRASASVSRGKVATEVEG